MPELTGLERKLGERLDDVLMDAEFEDLTGGEVMDVLSRFVAAYIASASNTLADDSPHEQRDEAFRENLTNEFGAFALMLANQVFVAASHGPMPRQDEAVSAEWLRRQMEEGGNAAA